jgi:hypothetical protein
VVFAFKKSTSLPYPEEASANGSGEIDIDDLTNLELYLFKSGPAPVGCI